MAEPSKKTSFEDALQELERIVHRLEDGNISLEEAIEVYQKGVELKKLCEKKLSEAKMKIESVALTDDVPASNDVRS